MHQNASKRGISAYVGVLLLVALSVAGGAIFLTLTGSLSEHDTNEILVSSQGMVLESAVLTHRELIAYIRNSGTEPIEIDKVYIDEIIVTEPDAIIEVNGLGEGDDKILGKEVGTLHVQPSSGFSRGKNFKFKIISQNNNIIEFQKKAPLEAPVVIYTDSSGEGISGINVQYQSSGWKDLGLTDMNGEVLLLLEPRSYRFRLSYGGATLQKTQNIANNPTVKFKTANVTVKLIQADGTPIPGATARYSASGWKTIGITDEKGQVSIELLPLSYNFRMTYGGATLQKQQNIEDNPLVLFQTDDVTIRLVSSIGEPIEGATVKYYAGGWQTIGTTNEDGEVSVSLMPMSYNFRITHVGATQQKTQDIGEDPFVVFTTELVTVKLVESDNDPIMGGIASYNAGGWNTIGNTDENGEVKIELLPLSYSFRMTYGGAYIQKSQNIEENSLVEYQTENVTIVVRDGFGPVENAYARYQSSGWQIIGYTGDNGKVSKEILPKSYRFRVTLGGDNYYVVQDVEVNPIVEFNVP